MDRSRCHPVLLGSVSASRCAMVSAAVCAVRAAGRSPAATARSPSLLWAMDRSRCRSVFLGCCLAPDFVTHFPGLIRQHPTGLRSSVGGSGHDREAGPGTGVQAPPEAVLVAVAEVRDLLAAGSSGGDDRRSCGESAGRPEHDPADTDGSQGRRARRVGGVDPAPTRCPRKRSILGELTADFDFTHPPPPHAPARTPHHHAHRHARQHRPAQRHRRLTDPRLPPTPNPLAPVGVPRGR